MENKRTLAGIQEEIKNMEAEAKKATKDNPFLIPVLVERLTHLYVQEAELKTLELGKL